MDAKIRQIEKTTKKAGKQLKTLERMDKKQDKKLAKCAVKGKKK